LALQGGKVSKERLDEKDPLDEDEEVKEFKVDVPKVNQEVLVKKPQGKKVRIVIEESDDENASNEVFVSVQGYAYQIRRGVPVEVPESVLEVLNHAVQTKMIQNMETYEMTYRDVPRYTYRILS
jgi:hypothetical protein